jgi:hypothetical protein
MSLRWRWWRSCFCWFIFQLHLNVSSCWHWGWWGWWWGRRRSSVRHGAPVCCCCLLLVMAPAAQGCNRIWLGESMYVFQAT